MVCSATTVIWLLAQRFGHNPVKRWSSLGIYFRRPAQVGYRLGCALEFPSVCPGNIFESRTLLFSDCSCIKQLHPYQCFVSAYGGNTIATSWTAARRYESTTDVPLPRLYHRILLSWQHNPHEHTTKGRAPTNDRPARPSDENGRTESKYLVLGQ